MRRVVALVTCSLVLLAACTGDADTDAALETTTTIETTTSGVSPTSEGSTTTTAASETGSGDPLDTGSPVLTPTGLADLMIGMTEAEASETRLIGEVGPGCELSMSRQADLRFPLASGDVVGSVDFFEGPLSTISVTDGVTTEAGIRVGEDLTAAQSTYGADLDVDRSFEEMFRIWIATISLDDGTIDLVIDPATEEITSMAAPHVAFCE